MRKLINGGKWRGAQWKKTPFPDESPLKHCLKECANAQYKLTSEAFAERIRCSVYESCLTERSGSWWDTWLCRQCYYWRYGRCAPALTNVISVFLKNSGNEFEIKIFSQEDGLSRMLETQQQNIALMTGLAHELSRAENWVLETISGTFSRGKVCLFLSKHGLFQGCSKNDDSGET